MNTQRIHLSSIVLTVLSFLFELGINRGWIETGYQDVTFGLSLALILIAMAMNVKIVRTMGVDPKEKRKSQLILLGVSLYAFLVYGLELI
jgi:hypothetical protein